MKNKIHETKKINKGIKITKKREVHALFCNFCYKFAHYSHVDQIK